MSSSLSFLFFSLTFQSIPLFEPSLSLWWISQRRKSESHPTLSDDIGKALHVYSLTDVVSKKSRPGWIKLWISTTVCATSTSLTGARSPNCFATVGMDICKTWRHCTSSLVSAGKGWLTQVLCTISTGKVAKICSDYYIVSYKKVFTFWLRMISLSRLRRLTRSWKGATSLLPPMQMPFAETQECSLMSFTFTAWSKTKRDFRRLCPFLKTKFIKQKNSHSILSLNISTMRVFEYNA